MPTVITATRYNNLRATLQQVMEAPGGQQGYGYNQSLISSSVLPNSMKITDEQYRALYIDLIRARAHQLGETGLSIDPFVIGDYETNTTNTDKIELAYIQNLETLMTAVETDKDILHLTQATVQNLVTSNGFAVASSRLYPPSWNGTISFIYSVNFDSVTAADAFFNAGGAIRNEAFISYTGSQAKTVDWQDLLSDMGTIATTANNTISGNSVGTSTNIGWYNLGSSYQTLYTKTGTSVYSQNNYKVEAYKPNTTSIQFKITLNDPSTSFDEPILGDVYTSVALLVPDGTVTLDGTEYESVVIEDLPTGSILVTL